MITVNVKKRCLWVFLQLFWRRLHQSIPHGWVDLRERERAILESVKIAMIEEYQLGARARERDRDMCSIHPQLGYLVDSCHRILRGWASRAVQNSEGGWTSLRGPPTLQIMRGVFTRPRQSSQPLTDRIGELSPSPRSKCFFGQVRRAAKSLAQWPSLSTTLPSPSSSSSIFSLKHDNTRQLGKI